MKNGAMEVTAAAAAASMIVPDDKPDRRAEIGGSHSMMMETKREKTSVARAVITRPRCVGLWCSRGVVVSGGHAQASPEVTTNGAAAIMSNSRDRWPGR